MHSSQRAAAFADRAPDRLDDHRTAHGSPLNPVV
jgi:hypothetical protein